LVFQKIRTKGFPSFEISLAVTFHDNLLFWRLIWFNKIDLVYNTNISPTDDGIMAENNYKFF
jgi:hypothetical protein